MRGAAGSASAAGRDLGAPLSAGGASPSAGAAGGAARSSAPEAVRMLGRDAVLVAGSAAASANGDVNSDGPP